MNTKLTSADWQSVVNLFKPTGELQNDSYAEKQFNKIKKDLNLTFEIPQSYKDYCNSFGPGTLKFGGIHLTIAVPCDTNKFIDFSSFSKSTSELIRAFWRDIPSTNEKYISLSKILIPFESLDDSYLCWNPKEIDKNGEPSIYLVNFDHAAGNFSAITSDINNLIAIVGVKNKFSGLYAELSDQPALMFEGFKKNTKP